MDLELVYMIKKYGIGLGIGGTGIKAAVVDSEGSMYRKKSYPTEYENPAWFAEKLISIGEALLEESEKAGQRIEVISVTFPGIVEDGVVTGGAENFPGIEPFPSQKMFADRFDLPGSMWFTHLRRDRKAPWQRCEIRLPDSCLLFSSRLTSGSLSFQRDR